MNNNKSFTVDLHDVRLKVFTVGRSPRVTLYNEPINSPVTMKIIHTHFAFEIFFVTSGRLKLVTEDDTREYENCVLIIPSGMKHYSFPSDNGSFCLLFTIDGDTKAGRRMKSILSDRPKTLSLDKSVAFYINAFTQKLLEKTPRNDFDANRLAELIFSDIVKQLVDDDLTGKSKCSFDEHIANIESFINGNLYNKITLDELSEAVHLSTRHISRIIKQKYGCSFSALVLEKRLAAAELLIRNSRLKITDISMQIFGSETYLYALFRKKFGMSPERFRKEKSECT